MGDAAPVVEGPAGGPTSANYAQTDGIDGSNGDTYWQNSGGLFDDSLQYRTEVGAYASATSYYGLFDVDGNAYQWLESSRPNAFNAAQDLPLFRGGSWFNGSDGSGAAFRNTQFFATGSSSLSSNNHGFRIARLADLSQPGDYNGDGLVDAEDYTIWRDGGSPDSTQAGYDLWAANFGAASSAQAQSAPEPRAALLAIIAMTTVTGSRSTRAASAR